MGFKSSVPFVLFALISNPNVLAEKDQKASGELDLKFTAHHLPNVAPIKIDMDRKTCGTERPSTAIVKQPDGGIGNLVVWLEPKDPALLSRLPPSAPGDSILNIKGCDFSPRVAVVQVDESIRIASQDPVLYQIRSLSQKNPKQSRSLPPNLASVQFRFREPEIVTLTCDLHSWMRAFVVVAPHSLYRVTEAKGAAQFKAVPNGTYSVFVWHELLGKRLLPETIEMNAKLIRKKFDLDFGSIQAATPSP